MAKWLDSLKTQAFYFSKDEVYCMINGNCGVRSYAPDMAAVLAKAKENTSGVPASDVEQYLRQWVDGNPSNGELSLAGFDPMTTNMRNNPNPGIAFYFGPNNLSPFTLDATTIQDWYAVARDFAVQNTTANPQMYGGSQATGLDMNVNSWARQDQNPR
ncbi:MAG: hypothetical protein ACREQV_01495 [Candidatus Binatia bacterium]